MPVLALMADALCVVVFAAVGRHSHAEADGVVGVWLTAWPFLLGLAAGWALAVVLRRRPPVATADALPVWALTVVVGMVARQVSGRGTAPSFVVVAALVLGLFLFGWRVVRGLRTATL